MTHLVDAVQAASPQPPTQQRPIGLREILKRTLEDAQHWLSVCFIPYMQTQGSARAEKAVLDTAENLLQRIDKQLRALELLDLRELWAMSAFHRPDGGVELPAGSDLLAAIKRMVYED